jgi:hypothetical protein
MAKEGMQNSSQMRITPTEISVLKNTFKGNEELLRLMRKIFLPELDPFAPLGQNMDLWLTIPADQLTNEQIVVNLKARNMLITHLDQMLLQIKSLVENVEDTPEQALKRIKQNSAK